MRVKKVYASHTCTDLVYSSILAYPAGLRQRCVPGTGTQAKLRETERLAGTPLHVPAGREVSQI